MPEDAQDGSVGAPKDGTVVPSDNLDALGDVKNKMPSGNSTAVNVFITLPDVSQIQRSGTGKNNNHFKKKILVLIKHSCKIK